MALAVPVSADAAYLTGGGTRCRFRQVVGIILGVNLCGHALNHFQGGGHGIVTRLRTPHRRLQPAMEFVTVGAEV